MQLTSAQMPASRETSRDEALLKAPVRRDLRATVLDQRHLDGVDKQAHGPSVAPGEEPASEDDGPMQFAVLLASGGMSAEALVWVQSFLATWINANASGTAPVSLERCAHLPASAIGVRKARRNVWLAKAMNAMDGANLKQRCEALSQRLDVFLSRGEWRRWKFDGDPPAGADALEAALFYVAKGIPENKGLSARQMRRILQGHSFPK